METGGLILRIHLCLAIEISDELVGIGKESKSGTPHEDPLVLTLGTESEVPGSVLPLQAPAPGPAPLGEEEEEGTVPAPLQWPPNEIIALMCEH